MSLTLKSLQRVGISVALVPFISLATPSVQAGTGDLDPSFADVGRRLPIPGAGGEARTVKLLEAGGILVGGGNLWTHRELYGGRPHCAVWTSNFARTLSEDGTVDRTFNGESVPEIEAYDLARQRDGSIVAVGRKLISHDSYCSMSTSIAVYRLGVDGSLDSSFGTDGVFVYAANSRARSLALEPDGRIVVAGVGSVQTDGRTRKALIVLRLLENGELDNAFASGGVYIGPSVGDAHQIRIARTHSGSYRVSGETAEGCAVVGLTTSGALDAAFGDAGIVAVKSAEGLPVLCGSLQVLRNGRLLVGGSDSQGVFAAQFRPNGAPDHAFTADSALAGSMSHVDALVAGDDGKVLIAGRGAEGTSIMRLLPSGERDTQFGDDGRTRIDLKQSTYAPPIVNDMAVGDDGSVIAVGDDPWRGPFAVRLIGDGGGSSPGVVSFMENQAGVNESSGRAMFQVRRTGGSDGAVSVRYRTRTREEATADQDFKARSGILHWPNGDTSTREFFVNILQDDGPPEVTESFSVLLLAPEGGAGLGTRQARVYIAPDGSPGGQIEIDDAFPGTFEEGGTLRVTLVRSHYDEGRVCADLTTRSGTATAGNDFAVVRSTHCWGDREMDLKVVEIAILDDGNREPEESFTIRLSHPTGGAIIGSQGTAFVTIAKSDPP